jgi:hypothetical protein
MLTKVYSPSEAASSKVVYDQIVLGAGTSGLTYLYYSARSGAMDGVNTPAVKTKTLVIGEFFDDSTLNQIIDRFTAARSSTSFQPSFDKLDEIIFRLAKEKRIDPADVRKSVREGSMWYNKNWT